MELMAKVMGINTSDGIYNILVVNEKNETFNLKISPSMIDLIKVGGLYKFIYTAQYGGRMANMVTEVEQPNQLSLESSNEALRKFFPSAPISMEYAIEEIKKYIGKIENSIIRSITETLIEEYKDKFFIYPAASKLHHAYVGGLAYHSIGMLHLSDGFLENYSYLDKNYVYAGILLHDIGKTIELTGVINTEYSLKGQLLGHLVLGAMEIERVAEKLGYKDTEEVLMLEHMLVSHHGQPQFGSAKRPMTPEALVLWYIDTIDSKFRVLGEELEKTEVGNYTDSIGVLDRMKIYKIK